MSDNRDLLIEIGTEELPPKALHRLATSFAEEIVAGLKKADLTHGDYKWFASPRRMAIRITALQSCQKDQYVQRRGPALSAAYDASGNPTRAAAGFAESCGVNIVDLETVATDKGTWLVYQAVQKGQATVELLQSIIETALVRLPVPKRMRWGESDVEFVRPVHWAIVLFGNDIIPCELLGVIAGNRTRGHRFHHPHEIVIDAPAEYESKLREPGFVIADFEERKAAINEMAIAAAGAMGGEAHIEPALLDEITSLIEWPVVITGSFDDKFLQLPAEVLIACMQVHQKYFPVLVTPAGQQVIATQAALLPAFITIANIESTRAEEIRQGNERVIRPRLTDAAFFWKRDISNGLTAHCEGLGQVIYQKELGTLADKTERISRLATFMAAELGQDVAMSRRAASLCKCDLLTDMVGEFPELQGTMGQYYALASGEDQQVAVALHEQYMPRHAGGLLPRTITGQILAIADKLDTLVGIFAIGQAPGGDRDPFGLRRAALGCLRIMIESELGLNLRSCLQTAARNYGDLVANPAVIDDVFDFMMERLRRYYLDDGIRHDVFDAVLAWAPEIPFDFHLRIHGVTNFSKLPEAASLAAANKRIGNILRQHAGAVADAVEPGLLSDPAELLLYAELNRIGDLVSPLLEQHDYSGALALLAGLRDTVDAFFEQVMVMCDDDDMRNNRLALLKKTGQLFYCAADISRLQVN